MVFLRECGRAETLWGSAPGQVSVAFVVEKEPEVIADGALRAHLTAIIMAQSAKMATGH